MQEQQQEGGDRVAGSGKGSTAKQAQHDAQEQLRAVFPPGSTARTILRHVTRSGMSCSISVVGADCEDVTWLAARALGDKIDRQHDGIKVGGCGMDMGFSLVYGLGRTLYPKGFTCSGKDCRSNDHSNGDRDYSPHHHADGGYAISQRWL